MFLEATGGPWEISADTEVALAHLLGPHRHLQEKCGFFLGSCGTTLLDVQQTLLVPNLSPIGQGFLVPRESLLRARYLADREGMTLLAFVHTHPAEGCELSPADEAAHFASGLTWVVFGRASGTWKFKSYPPPLHDFD